MCERAFYFTREDAAEKNLLTTETSRVTLHLFSSLLPVNKQWRSYVQNKIPEVVR